jgi:hypothetical protein
MSAKCKLSLRVLTQLHAQARKILILYEILYNIEYLISVIVCDATFVPYLIFRNFQ